MTDDIRNYSFDFEKEVNDLMANTPISEAVYFVGVDVSLSDDGPHVQLQHAAGDQKIENLPVYDNWISKYYEEEPRRSSTHLTWPDVKFIALRKKEPYTQIFGDKNSPLMRLHVLYHETGHTLIADGPQKDENHPYRECAADAYAALRLLQRFGRAAAPFLSMSSWLRSIDVLQSGENTDHLTTTVVDKIIADSARQNFSKLSPAETIALARSYAKKWTPKKTMLSRARPDFTQDADVGSRARTCLSSPDNFAFYIGAKFFQPFLKPGGVVFNGQTVKLTPKERRDIAATIEKRASAIGLRDVFNRAANGPPEKEPSLTELLKVSRPAGQKQFIYKI